MTQIKKSSFEIFYYQYSFMAYNMVLQISPNQDVAEQILLASFQKAKHQNIVTRPHPSPRISLIKIIIDTTHKHLNDNQGKTNFELRQFENLPMLQHLLCEQASIGHHCSNNNITKEETAMKLRAELLALRNLQITNIGSNYDEKLDNMGFKKHKSIRYTDHLPMHLQ